MSSIRRCSIEIFSLITTYVLALLAGKLARGVKCRATHHNRKNLSFELYTPVTILNSNETRKKYFQRLHNKSVLSGDVKNSLWLREKKCHKRYNTLKKMFELSHTMCEMKEANYEEKKYQNIKISPAQAHLVMELLYCNSNVLFAHFHRTATPPSKFIFISQIASLSSSQSGSALTLRVRVQTVLVC